MALAIGAVKATPGTIRALADRGQANELTRVTDAMDAQLTAAFQETRKFQVIARSDLGDLIKEQDLGASGNADASDPNVAKAGKVAGAKFVIIASVTDFQDNVQTATFEGIGKKATARVLSLSCVAKMYDASTGRLVEAVTLRADNSDFVRNPEFVTSEQGGSLTEKAVVELARIMSAKIANRLVDVLLPAKILSITDGVATINRGEGSGVKVDQVWKVSAQGKALIDPDTGEVLGRDEVSVGWIKITEVGPTLARGTVCAMGTSVDAGCVARLTTRTECPVVAPGAVADAPFTAAIFVRNRCKDIANEKVAILEDMMSARLEGACFKIVSREDVIDSLAKVVNGAAAPGAPGVQAAREAMEALRGGDARVDDLDRLLSDQSSATALAGNLGCQYVLIGALTSLDSSVKNFQDERLGVKTENLTWTLTGTYKILDASTGKLIVSGETAGVETYRNTPNLNTQLTITGPLFQQVAAGMCQQLLAKCAQAKVAAPGAAATGGLRIVCSMQDLTVPELTKNASGQYEWTGQALALQPTQLSATVELDGVVIGTAPAPNLAPLPASAGLHKIAVTRAGFKPWTKTINIRAGEPTDLAVALQLDAAGYERWKQSSAFLQDLKQHQQLTDAQVQQMNAFAEYLRNSKFSVDYKVNTTQAPVTIYPGIIGGQIVP
jgi:curli biogenesis system outer membrane secretion channel CsgG